jgi:queuosine precursor transporter
MSLTILAATVITAFTLAGAYYARKFDRPDGLIALYVLFAALSQIMAAKIAIYDLGPVKVVAPAAVLVFAVTFLITDIVNEKFGQAQVHAMILMTFVTQVALVVFLYIGGKLSPAPFWPNQSAWDLLLGVVPRITFASWVTFLVSENLDAWLYAFFRRLTKGKYLWARNVFSTIPALTVDTVIFITLAFAGTGAPLWELMKGQFATKYLVGVLCIPFMYINKAILGPERRSEASSK